MRTTLGALRTLVERREPVLQALVDEQGRWERLRRDLDGGAGTPAGVLVGVKDVIHVDGLPTRAGSAVPAEELAGPEASCVRRLRDAGATVLAKTVTAEFAFAAPGPTTNPRDPAHTPGGSSSGSAAAVAAGYCPVALGTQTIGSVIRPAAFCGVVGLKPTYGRIPADGIVPCAPSFDTVGLIAAGLDELAAAACVLCDGWGPAGPPGAITLAVPSAPWLRQADPAALHAFEAQLRALAAAGAVVHRTGALDDPAALDRVHRRLMYAEMAAVHAELFGRFGERYDPRTAAAIAEGTTVTADEIADGRASRGAVRAGLSATLDGCGALAWVAPAATGPAPRGLGWTGDPCMNLPWTHAGVPAVTVPAGDVGGLPVGLQLAGRGADDELLVEVARFAAAALRRGA